MYAIIHTMLLQGNGCTRSVVCNPTCSDHILRLLLQCELHALCFTRFNRDLTCSSTQNTTIRHYYSVSAVKVVTSFGKLDIS